MGKSHDVTEWLNGLDSIHDAKPVIISIKGERFEGAEYTNSVSNDRCFYLLGETPVSYVKPRGGKPCFIKDDETWYVAAGYTPAMCKPHKADFMNIFTGGDLREFHPFGFSWLLMKWPTEKHGLVDQYEERPRPRVPFSTTYL